MWGDAEGAFRLEASDALAAILFQVVGPAHIPSQDPRWQELLHGYDVWVHVEPRDAAGVIDQACKSLAPNAPQSSNLAAFSLHVARMLRELSPASSGRAEDGSSSSSAVDEFSNRIATVGRARATAGSLNLLRILTHSVIVHSRSTELQEQQAPDTYLQECFLYRSRDSTREDDSGYELLDALLRFVVSNPPLSNTIPELYDATALSLQLIVVLLSSQLYQPMVSSFQRSEEHDVSDQTCGFFWDILMELAERSQLKQHDPVSSSSGGWTPRSLLLAWMDWTLRRPPAPVRSIAHHNAELAKQVVKAKGERMGADGMYENYLVVAAQKNLDMIEGMDDMNSGDAASHAAKAIRRKSNILIDATKGVLILSSSVILLPFRLIQLALGLWGNKERGYDQAHRIMLQTSLQHSNLTKDALWLSDSPVGDLASCLMLLVLNNERAGENPFREEVLALSDNRWETDGRGLPDLPDLPNANGGRGGDEFTPLVALSAPQLGPARQDTLAVNFESLFESFGRTAHTEVGALLLYTLMQSSPSFAESLAVRSDLDTLVLPLLRTLYISSSAQHYTAQDFVSRRASRRTSSDGSDSVGSASTAGIVSIRNCPFRSQSQLYVIIILLLLFSQDASFGPDAFRRSMVTSIPWYKERNIKDVNLGSVLLLCLLRSLTFNLNRMRDAFLLTNCCATLANLSPSISDLHEYAAMRLAAITVSSMKRYATLHNDSPDDDEESMETPTAMHGEVCRTLLLVLKQCLNAKNIERNLNLVYSLVYHQADFKKLLGQKGSPFKKGQTDRVQKVLAAASAVIEQGGDARTAAKALKVLSENMDQIRDAVTDRRKRSEGDAFTFTYEEEADPEIFFVPYLWEVIVCVATSSSIEWNKSKILVFPLLDDPGDEPLIEPTELPPNAVNEFSKDVSDVV